MYDDESADVSDFGNKGGGDKERHASQGLISLKGAKIVRYVACL
jgi:hypothetical protein